MMPLRKNFKKVLTNSECCAIVLIVPAMSRNKQYGGIAQLGERLNGIQEVSGSIPLISTNKNLGTQ